jgi:hypothetical protein
LIDVPPLKWCSAHSTSVIALIGSCAGKIHDAIWPFEPNSTTAASRRSSWAM